MILSHPTTDCIGQKKLAVELLLQAKSLAGTTRSAAGKSRLDSMLLVGPAEAIYFALLAKEFLEETISER